jgi:hypothetical protein
MACTLMPTLHYESWPKKLWANFEHFWLVVCTKLLTNAGTLAPRVANWPPIFDGILFPALGPIQAHKVPHLLVTWGTLKRLFLVQL